MASLLAVLNTDELPSDPRSFKQPPPPQPSGSGELDMDAQLAEGEAHSSKMHLEEHAHKVGPDRVWTPSKAQEWQRKGASPRENGTPRHEG
jgi:hypothetical protein